MLSSLRLPLARSEDLRAPELRGPVSGATGVEGTACAISVSIAPDETTVLTTVASVTSFFGLDFGAGYNEKKKIVNRVRLCKIE